MHDFRRLPPIWCNSARGGGESGTPPQIQEDFVIGNDAGNFHLEFPASVPADRKGNVPAWTLKITTRFSC